MRSSLKKLIKRILTPKGDKSVDIVDIKLTFNQRDNGGLQYEARSSIEERNNLFYDILRSTLDPNLIIDVGANYGFTGAVFAKRFPGADLMLIEPDPKLGIYIKRNMSLNGISRYRLTEAICADQEGKTLEFGINPHSSQDNRVRGSKGWKSIQVQTITLTSVLRGYPDSRVFIKVDTQGFETQVFKGAEKFLSNSQNWFVKSEFAPDWLLSQGNSPEGLLKYLIKRYRVVEAPARTRFRRDHLPQLLESPLTEDEVEPFIEHVKSLNKQELGWVDIYIAPKNAKWLVEET